MQIVQSLLADKIYWLSCVNMTVVTQIQRAFEQVKALAQNKDIANVIKQLHPTFLHNQKLLLDNESRLQRIKNFLCPYLIAGK